VALGRRLNAGLNHDREILLPLAVAALTFGRATAPAETVESLVAAGAGNHEAMATDWHAVDVLRAQPILRMASAANIVVITAVIGAKPRGTPPRHHRAYNPLIHKR
jgi:hypothetical protein